MTEQDEKVGEILNALGQHIFEIIGQNPDGSFLYAEVDDGAYEVAIFHDEGERVVYYDPDSDLFDEVMNLWETALEHEKWTVLEYDVRDGRFNSSYTYADQLDPDEDSDERRDRLVRARFGDKPVIYPPLGPDAVELTLEDLAHLDDDKD
ncbi:hypothetical protein DXH95_01090 [Sphingorhabdus pulchriflava]|uniref:DUF600 family protein n=1 Tax=Sphingorhabdus pulchriflava TaxID=2292257 RepID=A0A371BEQ5_9SPHN|nr:hypothetical protein [Sphingorhabdus pulchriflava]RDV06072.1 hypothetical protein DXH95_01090 [Sphingorhabdus pulchriflava]